jgi:hypothetical protein
MFDIMSFMDVDNTYLSVKRFHGLTGAQPVLGVSLFRCPQA